MIKLSTRERFVARLSCRVHRRETSMIRLVLAAALLLVTLGSGSADAHETRTTLTVQDLRQITTLIRDARLNKEAFGR